MNPVCSDVQALVLKPSLSGGAVYLALVGQHRASSWVRCSEGEACNKATWCRGVDRALEPWPSPAWCRAERLSRGSGPGRRGADVWPRLCSLHISRALLSPLEGLVLPSDPAPHHPSSCDAC